MVSLTVSLLDFELYDSVAEDLRSVRLPDIAVAKALLLSMFTKHYHLLYNDIIERHENWNILRSLPINLKKKNFSLMDKQTEKTVVCMQMSP